MKQFFFKTLICTGLAIPFLTGCTNGDAYDPEAVRQRAEKAFGIAIDPEQDWNMIETVKARISIKEDALSGYTFKVYTANPLTGEGAALLAKKAVSTDAQGRADANLTFDMPSYMEYVYVARVDDHGRRLVKIAKVSEGVMTAEFGGSVTGTVATRGMETDVELPKMDCPYTKGQVEELIGKAYDVKNGIINQWGNESNRLPDVLNADNAYTAKVTTIYEKDIALSLWGVDSNDTYKLIIANGGTLKLVGNSEKQIVNIDVIIADGGTLDITNIPKLRMNNKARIIIMPGGKLMDNNKNLEVESNNYKVQDDASDALIYNAGTIDIKQININFGSFYNAETGVFSADEIYLSNSQGGIITNWGHITVKKIQGNGNQGTINNGCSLIATEKLELMNLNQAAKTLIQSNYIKLWNLTMRENSILRSENLYFNNSDIRYIGEGGRDKEALISTKNIKFVNVGKGGFKITKNIYFEANTQSEDGGRDFFGTIDKAIEVAGGSGRAKVGEANILIASGGCSGQGNTPDDYVEQTPDTPNCYTYAFEDMDKDGGDYDMNDVVLQCSIPQDGKITVTLVAAGASKDLTIHFKSGKDGTETVLFGGKEVHDLFGVEKGELVNTGSGPDREAVKTVIEVGEYFSFKDAGDFYIKDEKGRESHVPAFDPNFETGGVPYAICVPTAWQYPAERCRIESVYPKFKEWAGNIETGNDWYVSEAVSEN